jgi:non-heme chloroperoxidase
MAWRMGWVLVLALTASCGGTAGSDLNDEPIDTGRSEFQRANQLKRIALRTGVELQYLEQGQRHGEPVIFLHGYTDSHHSFDLNLPRFPQRFHVFALDQRGHGDSSKPACCYTQHDFAADVVAFMDALGLRKASLVGHSMGSFIAHKVAVDYPRRVDELVLIGSAPTVAGNPGATELKAAVDSLTDPVDPEFVRAFQASTFFRPIPASYLDTAVSESLKVPATVWRQALDGLIAEDHSSRLGRITARTLILYGDQDVFFSLAEQHALDAAIPRSRLIVYSQAGHGTHAELPARVAHDIVRFLD